jgi:catalase-peroxidase
MNLGCVFYLILIIKELSMSDSQTKGQCPFIGATTTANHGTQNKDWWPNALNLDILRQQDTKSNPNPSFNYRAALKTLDFEALKADLKHLMKDSQDWWPADYGHYGPFFIRMSWHAAGTYRIADGRGGANTGNQRFAPLNSWPDNGNLDKARRLLWPIKQKYGNALSWADLLVLAGTVAIEDMGGPSYGIALGREDIYHPEKDVYWGSEAEWLGDNRYSGTRQDLETPLAAVQMGLIYVNPEGPNGVADALLSAEDIRETFKRMSMNDEETFALIAGGHAFGKAHGNGPAACVGPDPESSPLEQQGLGWISTHQSGKGIDTITSGIEGPWTPNPIQWDTDYLRLLFSYEWFLKKSPAGAQQWHPMDCAEEDMAIEVDGSGKKVLPMMTTADLALKFDPIYRAIGKRFLADTASFEQAFAKAWFKLIHRDLGPKSNYVVGDFCDEVYLWQDPIKPTPVPNQTQLEQVKLAITASGLSVTQRVETAWASASTFRKSDYRGGANGARIRLLPQRAWAVNKPIALAQILAIYETISEATGVSIADIIVFAAKLAIEEVASTEVPFSGGRGDATQEETDVDSFAYLEPRSDGFRNYLEKPFAVSPEAMLLDKAHLLNLSPVEMTVLVGGLRSLGVTANQDGVWNKVPSLNQQWFKTLLAMDVQWKELHFNHYQGIDLKTGQVKRTASRIDLLFASNSELRAIAEFYAQDDNEQKFVADFVAAWHKVMNADRFDLL